MVFTMKTENKFYKAQRSSLSSSKKRLFCWIFGVWLKILFYVIYLFVLSKGQLLQQKAS